MRYCLAPSRERPDRRVDRAPARCVLKESRCGLALFGFGKKSDDGKGGASGAGESNPGDDGQGFNRSLRNANKFFDYGDTAADSKNFDYAVECYIGGLRHNPDNLDRHEQLHEIAKRRSVSGGKPLKAKAVGPSLVDKMLRAEKNWATDWNNVDYMVDTIEAAVEADRREGEEANLAEVAYWVAGLALQYNANPNNRPNRRAYMRIIDAMEKIEAYDLGLEAARRAMNLKEEDSLRERIRDLTAQNYTKQSSQGEGEGFRKNIKNAQEQERIQQQLDTSGSQTDKLIASMRELYEENPEDVDRLQKLVEALTRSEDLKNEQEAIDLLLKAHEHNGQYRYKVKAGDIRIKQFGRVLRQLGDKAKAGDESARQKLSEALKKRLVFELKEYGERAANYPTDLKLKFELGKRQYQAGLFDDAIGNFQQATSEPKSRAAAHLFLGRCFIHKQWTDEATSTLEKGIELHPEPDDVVGKELRYELMCVYLTQAGKNRDVEAAKKAQSLASELLQYDINYKDIREKMDQVRQLVNELK